MNAVIQELEEDELQAKAVARCCDMGIGNRVFPITGAAGTGKTTIIREVYNTLSEAGYRVVLCAPTGKAAKRIHEATGIVAMTLHRLLEYPFPGERDEKTGEAMDSGLPKRKSSNPVEFDVVIADEYAMVNREVHSNLIFALPRAGRILLFGDTNQLRPIEKGLIKKKDESPFQQAIRRFQGITLEKVYRHGEGSGIAENGKAILNGRMPKRYPDFELLITDSPVKKLQEFINLRKAHDNVDYSSIENQIISSTKKSWIGTYKINRLLQGMFNPVPRDARLALPRHKWAERMPVSIAEGDKVIWTENAYDLRSNYDRYITDEDGHEHFIEPAPEFTIMNGETGIIQKIDEEGNIELDVGDRIVYVPHTLVLNLPKKGFVTVDPRKVIELAYCITTHKSQGSEYKNVIYLINKSTYFMQCRSNIYTAITRAREHAAIISDQRSLLNSISRIKTVMESKKR
jgi:exodeoxyribonuclease V alpha subunit